MVDSILDGIEGYVVDPVKNLYAAAKRATGGAVTGAAHVAETFGNAANNLSGQPVFDGKADGIRSIAQDLAASADATRASVSAATRQAQATSVPTGNLFKGELDLGEDPSLRGYVNNIAEGLGSVVPGVATAVATRGRSIGTQAKVGAAVGGLTGGGFAAQEEGARVRAMTPEQLAALPVYQQGVAGGLTPDKAREAAAMAAERGAFAATAPVSALGGAATSALIGKPVQGVIGRMVGNSKVGQTIASGLIGAGEEGVQEVGEGVAQRFGASTATGEQGRELGEESAANLVLGVTAGGGPAALAGAAQTTADASDPVSPDAGPASTPQAVAPAGPVVVNPHRGVLSRAVAVGAAEGTIAGVEIEATPPGFNAPPPPDGVLPELPPNAPQLSAPAAGMAALNPDTIERPFAPLGRGFGADAATRDLDEADKPYAKRVIDQLPAPTREQLPSDPSLYFHLKKADAMVPLAQLLPSKGAQPVASANALKRMAAAAEGLLDRRQPIDVRAHADGSYTVLDGNGTLGAALTAGLRELPVRIREADEGREGWRNPRGYLDAEPAQALTRVYEQAAAAKPEFDATNAAIAERLGVSAATVELKGRTRAEQKARDDYAGNVGRLNDLVRTTFEVNDLGQVEDVLREVQASYPETVGLKHYLAADVPTPYAGGYRDSKVVVALPNGSKAEVQINLKPMLAAKQQAHPLYEQWRVLDARITKENRAPTPEERARLDELEAAQAAIYAPAWDAVTSAANAASSTSTPLLRTESRENALGAAPSSANTPRVAPSSYTGTPSTLKNRVPGGNEEFTGAAPVVGSPNSTTDAVPAGFNKKTPGANLRKPGQAFTPSTEYGVIVAPKPGTMVQDADGSLRPYQRGIDGANQPPAQAPVQRAPDLDALQAKTAAIFKRPAAAAALRKAFGITGLKTKTIRGSYMGVPELSFHLTAEGLSPDNAGLVAQALGLAFAQDAVIVTKPDPVGPTEDSIPTLELYNTDGTALDDAVFTAVTAELQAQGIDYSEARDGRAIRVLHFGDEAGLESLAVTLAAAAQAHGLSLNHLHTRSDLYEAQDYRRNLGQGGDQAVRGFGPEVFRALVDHVVVPYTRAIGGVGYRFDADRYGARFGLDKDEVGYLKQKLAPEGVRSTVGLLSGDESVPARGKGRPTNADAAWFLQNRAAALGAINPKDRSAAAKAVISDTFADEVEYQLSKPEGKQAVGWYDRQLKSALKTIAGLHPEIATDPRADFVFKALLAATSQGLTVIQNFNVALKLYEGYKAKGKFELKGITLPGSASTAAKKNIDKVQALINERGIDATAAFMRGMHTVRELKQQGFKDVSGLMTDRVRGWVVLGPKIGSFGNNLDGDFDTLTADLWFSRTWNRTLGQMFRYSPKQEAENLRTFRKEIVEALNNPGSNAVVDALTEDERAKIGELDADLEIAHRIYRAYAKGFKDRTTLNRVAKVLVENAHGTQDVPRGDPERRWQDEVMRETQRKVEERTGQHVQIADLQALLWYQEKELFRLLGAANKASAPLDYQDAAKAAIAQVEGRHLGRKDDATVVAMAFPVGRDYLMGKLRRIVKDARIVPLAGTDSATSRVAIDRELSPDEQEKVGKLGGVAWLKPGAFPSAPAIEASEKAPPRFQVPHGVLQSKSYAALDSEQQAAVDDALASLKKKGYPKAWLQGINYFFAHNADKDFAARYYIDGETVGAVSLRQDQFAFERLRPGFLEANLAHEIGHSIDFDSAVGGTRTSVSPRFALTRNADGGVTMTGDIAAELARAHKGLTPLTHALNYPLATPEEMSDDVLKTELFAQAVMLYYTQRADLKRHAPVTHAMLEEMTREANLGPDRAAAAVSQALRAGRVRPVDFRVPSFANRQADRGVDRGEQDRSGARGADDQRDVDGSAAFKRWFGDSRVVDKSGKPLVVYHGTRGDFDTFDTARQGQSDFGASGRGFYFSQDPGTANVYATLSPSEGAPSIIPVYLAVSNPYEMGALLPRDEAQSHLLTERVKAAGHDGIIVRGADGVIDEVIAFRPEQIKSSIANNGNFDPAEPRFLGSGNVPPPAAGFAGYTLPSDRLSAHLSDEAGKRLAGYQSAAKAGGDKLRTYLQDYFLPVRRVQEAITARGGTVTEDTDVYGREELYYGRTGEQLRQLEDEHVKPLVKALHAAGVAQADLELYLYAKFAPARNARIAEINPAFPDGGSGMSNADAAAILADFEKDGATAKLEALAQRVRAMNAKRVDVLEEGGLLSPGEAELWRSEPDYVPLKGIAAGFGDDDSGTRLKTGGGFSIGGKEAHRALGRKSRATDLLANTIAQVEQAIIRSEKNRVALALLRLAEENPNPALWEVDKETQVPYLTPSGEVAYRKDTRQQLADNVVSAKVAGTEHFITLKDQRLAAAMKNLGAAKTGAFLRGFSAVNRFLSLTRTMLAPEFVLANFARDLQTASINLTGDQSAAMAARVVADVPKAMRAMWGQLRGKSQGGEWSRWAQEFADAGGMTSFVSQRTVEEQQAKIKGLLADANAGLPRATLKLAKATLELVEDVNGAVENGTRLSAYAAARRNGSSQQEAARLAKNLTVNFNRKGQAGPVINALYLFYNASIQGTQRFLRAMRSPKVQAIMATTAFLGYGLAAYNRAAGGEDDDGEDKWDKIPDWEKARNLIIFLPGGEDTIKIPLPYTYNLPFLIGSEVEAMANSKREPSSAAANIAEAILGAFNPIGDLDLKGDSATAVSKLAAPTALDPLVDIAVNQNFFGSPINPERSPFDKVPEPDSELAYPSVNPAARWLAKALNSATGGDALRPGLIDVSPGSMVYIFDYLTGGTGSFVERSATAAMLMAQGEDVPANKVPFARVFHGELSERRVTDTFYRLRDEVNLKAELAKSAPKGGYVDAEDKADARLGRKLAPRLKAAERQLRGLRDRRKKAQLAGNAELVKRFEAKERAVQLRFNRQYFELLDRQEEHP